MLYRTSTSEADVVFSGEEVFSKFFSSHCMVDVEPIEISTLLSDYLIVYTHIKSYLFIYVHRYMHTCIPAYIFTNILIVPMDSQSSPP